MKVIHVLNYFLPNHIAGTEMYAFLIGKELKTAGYKVKYIIPNYGSSDNDTYEYKGIQVLQYGEPSAVDRALQMGKREPDGLKNFVDIVKKEKPDIVHFHEIAGSNGITLHHVRAAKDLGCRIVMTFHLGRYTATSDSLSNPSDVFNNFLGSLNFYKSKGFGKSIAGILYSISLLFKILRIDTSSMGKAGTALAVSRLVAKKKKDFFSFVSYCDCLVAIAHWYHKLLVENGVPENKLTFIEQGIHLNGRINRAKKISNGLTRLIFVGRISHFKGVKLLIEAVTELNNPNLQLDIYGDSGEDDNYIRECRLLADKISLIHFKGRISPDRTIQVMSEYDILVLPSTFSEMSPLVIREAFAAGIPVLASDSMGASEQIRDGVNGWLFKMNDRNDLIEKLKMLIAHPEKIEEAGKHLPPVRTMKEVAEEYERVYARVTPRLRSE